MLIRLQIYLIIGCLALLPGLCAGATILNGSDLLGGPIEKAIEQELRASGSDIEIELQGSLLGSEALENGGAGACLLAIPDSEEVPEDYRRFPIAFQIAAFLVHDTNPVQELSYAELARLFGNQDPIENWADLTSSAMWSDRKIALRASRQDHLMTMELFNEEVLKRAPFVESLQVTRTPTSKLHEIIRLDPNLIILVPYMESLAGDKYLDVKASESDQSYNPSPSNIYYGDYPLRLPFYLVISDSLKRTEVKTIIQALLSPSVTKAFIENNFVPLPDQEMRDLLSRFD